MTEKFISILASGTGGHVYPAYTIANDQAHELNSKYRLNRFNTGHLIDEKGVGTKTWIG